MPATDTPVVVDHDIEEMLRDIEQRALQKRLIVFNDDHHDMLEVLIQIMLAREVGGQPCTPEQARSIMMEEIGRAHV